MVARLAAVALSLVTAACRVARPGPATASVAPPGDCRPVGTWRVTWAPDVTAAHLHALSRDFALQIDEATAAVDGWQVLTGASEDDARAEVDRARCVARVSLRSEFAFADDAGDRTEALTLELDLHGDGGGARGTLHLREDGYDPEDLRTAVGGRVARVVDEEGG